MPEKYFKYLFIILFVCFVIPQIAFASWWNPFSWNIWNNIFSTFNKSQVVHVDSPIVSQNNSVITENTSKNTETEQQKIKPETKTENQTPPTPINQTPEPICAPDWECETWSLCKNSLQTRVCIDANSCGVLTNKPLVAQSCTIACSPNWQTGLWSTCQNGQQIRTVSDSNNCEISTNKPITTQSCTPPTPTCQSDTWECGNWDSCSVSGNQTRSCSKTSDCPSVNTPSPTRTQSCTPPMPTQTENQILNISVNVPVTTTNSAQITWNTNIPSSAKVFLTLDNGSIQVIPSASGYSTQHLADIPNLKADTQYSYTIEAIGGTQIKKETNILKTRWEDPYSDYVFNNASPTVGVETQWQIWFSVAPTVRDIRVNKAVFKISDENAVKLDVILNKGDGSSLSFILRHPTKNVVLPLERANNNTFMYESTSGISIGKTNYPLSLIFTVVADQDSNYRLSEENRALMESITVPMSEWIIMDQSNGKQVKTW